MPSVSHARRGPDALTIRTMRPDEASRVGELTLAGYDAYGSIQGEYRRFLRDPLRRLDGSTDLLVALRDDEVVGTVTFVLPGDGEWEGRPTPEGDCGFRVLAVDPAAEGGGIGRALVRTCIERSRALDRHRCVITSMEWMTRAHALYGSLGFDRRPDLDVRFPGGVGVVFTLDLTDEAPARFPAPGPVPATPPWYEEAWGLAS